MNYRQRKQYKESTNLKSVSVRMNMIDRPLTQLNKLKEESANGHGKSATYCKEFVKEL